MPVPDAVELGSVGGVGSGMVEVECEEDGGAVSGIAALPLDVGGGAGVGASGGDAIACGVLADEEGPGSGAAVGGIYAAFLLARVVFSAEKVEGGLGAASTAGSADG
jgi:hypothetical protein